MDAATSTPSCVQLQIMSDLHLETPRFHPMYEDLRIDPQCPYLALLGDIGHVQDERLFSFLRTQLLQFEMVFYVLGNHEPYMPDMLFPGGPDQPSNKAYTYDVAISMMQDFEASINAESHSGANKTSKKDPGQSSNTTGRFVFLHRRRFDLSDTVTILGTTLFSYITEEQRSTVSIFVSDFSNIQDWSVDSHNAAHAADLAWLNQQVEEIAQEPRERSIIVLTHHSPTSSSRANDPEHVEDSKGVQSAFVTSLSDQPCWTSPCVKVWAFGHTHFNCDFLEKNRDAGTAKRILANQRGYGREDAFDFDPEKVITVG